MIAMIFRRILLVLLLVGGFWYVVNHNHPAGLVPGSGMGELHLSEAHAAPEYDAEELNNIAVYKKVLPSVVNITATSRVLNFFFEVVPQQGQGSGFILTADGKVLTNFHVISNRSEEHTSELQSRFDL